MFIYLVDLFQLLPIGRVRAPICSTIQMFYQAKENW